jgi:1-pyrroline-5-carboxylate dehydrogenase
MTQNRKRIRVTYSTLSSPDPLLHTYFEEDVTTLKASVGGDYPMYINGEWRTSDKTFEKRSPGELDLHMGTFYEASNVQVAEAITAAKAAFPAWRDTPWQKRVEILGRVAELISERLFMMSASVSLEVGKNRLEAIGEVEETADLIRYCIDAMERHQGFIMPMNNETTRTTNHSVLKPYGVWGVISPFNYPCALSGGPIGAALLAGNTVVHKPASEAPYVTYLLAQCFEDAGVPTGVYNMVTGGDEPGKAIVASSDVAGLTFTGSYEVGMSIIRDFSTTTGYVRPVIAEMGGKNPTIVAEKADIDKAAAGVMRSAFGATGQKCSACSRVYVHSSVHDEFTKKLVANTEDLVVGNPTEQSTFMGPLVDERSYNAYRNYIEQLRADGEILTGGETLEIGNGYYVAPTVVANLPENHSLWKKEMFAPIVTVAAYDDPATAMALANDVPVGLTAGFFSEDDSDVAWFLEQIEAGVLYVNRDAGSTTGAWPGYQAFGGWKGSTGTNKAAGSHYYLQQYMREQSHTIVD